MLPEWLRIVLEIATLGLAATKTAEARKLKKKIKEVLPK